ncbi:hypothetical protein GCM10007877_29270 [Marinibactrum halimedae]|uniref:NADAR domain-containing protein n=1 Tax=Marinibactrum halimedae TaxID=1444977 RepID=A0AA37T991_9GAMM|nr:NADAR family protein [Marinibactrum halimedae]GLS27208.1 hypothetical protein GCM10007877_29270 [Marinibactrum halimedae]
MFQHDDTLVEAVHFSRLDPDNVFSTVSSHEFELEGQSWPTVEHYYQAKKFQRSSDMESILASPDGLQAYRWWKRGRLPTWKQNRRIMMTRALYTKTMAHKAVREALLATGDEKIVETSLYSPYWGIGRDQRGENMLGQIWMDIRAKIRADMRVSELKMVKE